MLGGWSGETVDVAQESRLRKPTKTIVVLRHVFFMSMHIPIVSVLTFPLALHILSKNISMMNGTFGSAPLTVLFIILLREHLILPLADRIQRLYIRAVTMHAVSLNEQICLKMEAVYAMDMIGSVCA